LPSPAVASLIFDICENVQKKAFDMSHIQNADTFFVDLDGTIRETSHWKSLRSENLQWLHNLMGKKPNTYVITNNTSHSLKEIATKLKIPIANVRNPLTSLNGLIPIGTKVYVIGNEVAKNQITEMGYILTDKDAESIIIANTCIMGIDEWVTVSEILSTRDADIYVTEDVKEVLLSRCSDYPSTWNYEKDLYIPDISTYTEMIKSLFKPNKIHVLGKPMTHIVKNIPFEKAVVIGDSWTTDKGLAENLQAYSVMVDKDRKVGYDYLINSYIISSVTDIIV
jgi:ribonucleotide monophosphatase NagD (HAD superfamily)